MNIDTKIVMLGSGSPDADPDRSGPSVAVVVGDKSYIVDFGAGVVRRAAAAYRKGIMPLKPCNLTLAFLTHLHSDHTLGYPDLILSPWVLGRKELLTVYGPKGLQDMTDNLLLAYKVDIDERRNGIIKADMTGSQVDVHEIETEGIIYKDENVMVEAISVNHCSFDQCFAYKFTTPDKVIVISGDTNPSEHLVEFAKGCDILVHEVFYNRGLESRPAKWRNYHSSVHTSAEKLGEIANKISPKLLITYHPVFLMGKDSGDTPNVTERINQRIVEMIEDIKENYHGDLIFGKDDDIYQ